MNPLLLLLLAPFAHAVDADGDGWDAPLDCDDTDSAVSPGAVEIPVNGRDENCDGRELCFVDLDGDRYGGTGAVASTSLTCTAPGVSSNTTDCNDTNSLVAPGQPEWCDGVDNDCDGLIDGGIPVRTFRRDADGDGYSAPDATPTLDVACAPSLDWSPLPTDCDDQDASVHPLITEADRRAHLPLALKPVERSEADRLPARIANVGDGIDQDCDGVDTCYADLDRDGYGAPLPAGALPAIDNDLDCRNLSAPTSANGLDCDDGDPSVHPQATNVPGDGVDQDCDGGDLCFEDLDGDGFGSANPLVLATPDCDDVAGAASRSGDCNDSPGAGASAFPGAAEVCDGLDNDCDGAVDEVIVGVPTFYVDEDGDGHGDPARPEPACGLLPGLATADDDCDDSTALVSPSAPEVCANGVDDDCDGLTDEDCGDTADTDTGIEPVPVSSGCQGLGVAYTALLPLAWPLRRRRKGAEGGSRAAR